MIEGIDVSSNNGTVNWQQVATSGIQRVGIRADVGLNSIDPKLYENANGARGVGLDFYVYGVCYPRMNGRPQDADKQAKQLASLHSSVGATLPPAVDVEPSADDRGAHGSEWRDAVCMYMQILQSETGTIPILYTVASWWDSIPDLRDATEFASYPLWVADYEAKPNPSVPKLWNNAWTGWQYAGGAGVIGRIPGVNGAVDRTRWTV